MAYFSNSSEGSILDQQCAECPIEDEKLDRHVGGVLPDMREWAEKHGIK